MKKFLFLVAILVLNHAQAGSLCATRSATNCQTARGFLTEQASGCAGPNTNCRRMFCEYVCAPCPGAPEISNLCKNNCIGLVLKGSEADVKAIHAKLASCPYLGAAASYENASVAQFGNKDIQALSSTIPGLVRDYEKKIEAVEQALSMVNQANDIATIAANAIREAAKKLYATPEQGVAVAENLIGLLNRKAQVKAGTYIAPTQSAPVETLSRRQSRRAARQASGAYSG